MLFVGECIQVTHIVESAALPNSLIRSAGGKITFEESKVRVS